MHTFYEIKSTFTINAKSLIDYITQCLIISKKTEYLENATSNEIINQIIK